MAETQLSGRPKSPSPRRRSTALKVGKALVALAILLPALGAAVEYLQSRRVARSKFPPGRLVDVGGVLEHIDCVGTGGPTVVFVSGTGEGYEAWSKVQPQVALFARACSYDRAGLGWSEGGPRPRDLRRMSAELHALLQASGTTPPYLLVGHSLGGGLIVVFAHDYPAEVAGLVMVDAAHPDLFRRIKPDARDDANFHLARWLSRLAPFGVARVAGMCTMDGRPLPHCAAFWETFVAEREELPESMRELGAIASLGDLPLTVLSRDPDPKVGWGSP